MSTATNSSGVRYETCESGQTTAQMCASATKEYYDFNKILAFTTISDTTIQIENATINFNRSTNTNTGGSGNANGWYFNKSTMTSYDDGSTVSLPHSNNHTAPLCSRNWGDKYHSNEIEFSITAPYSGQICFWWKGESEENYDKFTYKFNGTTIFNEISGYYSTYQQRCENVTEGSTYTFYFKYSKDKNTNSGIDMYCIDDIALVRPQPTSDPSNMTCSNCKTSGKCYTYCGDGTKNGSEACDSGFSDNTNSWKQNYHCNADCTAPGPYCGDGVKQSQEKCEYNVNTTTCYTSYTDSCCTHTDFWGDCDKWENCTRYKYYTVSCNTTGCTWNTSGKTQISTGNGSNGGYAYCPNL